MTHWGKKKLVVGCFSLWVGLSVKDSYLKDMGANVGDTIYAVATPPGRSAIAVIRISGENAEKRPLCFQCLACRGQFNVSRLMHAGKVLDRSCCSKAHIPVQERMCEIHCHASCY